MNWREEHYANLLKERGWEVGAINPYFTGNKSVSITNATKGITGTAELTQSELERVNTWAFWKALGIESRLLKEKVQTDLLNTFEEAARFHHPLKFDIPQEWYEAQRLEEYQLEVFAELRGHEETLKQYG